MGVYVFPCLSLTLLGIVCKQCCNYKTPSTNWFQLPGNLQHRETIKCKLCHALQHYLLPPSFWKTCILHMERNLNTCLLVDYNVGKLICWLLQQLISCLTVWFSNFLRAGNPHMLKHFQGLLCNPNINTATFGFFWTDIFIHVHELADSRVRWHSSRNSLRSFHWPKDEVGESKEREKDSQLSHFIICTCTNSTAWTHFDDYFFIPIKVCQQYKTALKNVPQYISMT